ncbi:unnamed protein product [Rotaria sordida]|uniref:Uncharacterized protein n=1 Tax=Rotaria sordida TaxID=392033 RepID=A0A814Z5C9_9BILA|nr:unnamed protein product [Rotaria sordida]
MKKAVDMIQGNGEFAGSSQSAGKHDVLHHRPSVIRVVKSSDPNRQHLKNNIGPTKEIKVNKIIHIRIQSPKKTAPVDSTNDLLSFSSILTARHQQAGQNQSSIVQNSTSLPRNGTQVVNNTEPTQYHQPGSRSINSGWAFELKNFNDISSSKLLALAIILIALFIAAAIAGIVAGVVITLKNTATTETTTIATTQTTTSQTSVTQTTTTSVTTTTKTTTTSITTTTTTTSVTTTTTRTTTTSITTTTTTTSVTTTTATTTTTKRPVICPSAVWHPSGTTVAGSSSGTSGSTPSLLRGAYDVRVDSALNVNLNLYDDDDTLTLNTQLLSTRVLIISLSIALLLILLFTGIIPQTRVITVSSPSVNNFENLINSYPTTTMCRCSQTSVLYSQIVSLNARFHQVCSSDFVSEEWFSSLFNVNTSNYYPLDFRLMASAQFQILSILCRMSRQAVIDALKEYAATAILSPNALSRDVVTTYIGTSIEQFQKTTLDSFRSHIHFILSLLAEHRFISALRTNFYTRGVLGSNNFVTFPAIYPQQVDITQSSSILSETCQCDRTNNCIYPAGIYNQTKSIIPNEVFSLDVSPLFMIPGFQVGCVPQNALFQSTLECFYNETCLDIVISLTGALRTISPLNISNSNSRFSPTTTIAVLFDNLMIESWEDSIDFATYFQICAPKTCSYSYVQRFFLIYIITTIVSVFGGIRVTLHIASPLFVKFILYLCRRRVSVQETEERYEPKRNLQDRIWNFLKQIRHKIITLNLFKKTLTNVQHGIYSTRVYIILLILGIYILIIYSTSIVSSQQIIVRNPSVDQFEHLHDMYSSILSCPCNNSSIPRSKFISIEVKIHPFCTSHFVRDDRWFQYWTMKFLNGSIDPTPSFYFNDFHLSNITALDPNTLINFKPQDSLEVLILSSLVNQLIYTANYTLYYAECQPKICTYTIDQKLHAIARINLVIGLIGGLTILLRILVPSFIKIIYLFYGFCHQQTRDVPLRWRMIFIYSRDKLYLINVYRGKTQALSLDAQS